MVHHSAQAVDRFLVGSRRSGQAATLLVTLAAVALIAGCGGTTNTQPQVDVGPNVGQPIALADCHDWQQANVEQRLGTIQQIKDFAGGPVVGNNASSPSGRGPVLGDKQAYDLFNGWCSQSFARGFKLYHLYQRAASFANVPQQ